MSPCATRSAQRTAALLLDRGLRRGDDEQLAQLDLVEAAQQRQPEDQLALGEVELGVGTSRTTSGQTDPTLRVDDRAQRGRLRLVSTGPSVRGRRGQNRVRL